MNTFENFNVINLLGMENIFLLLGVSLALLYLMTIKLNKVNSTYFIVLSVVFFMLSSYYSQSIVGNSSMQEYDEYFEKQEKNFKDYLISKKMVMLVDNRITEQEMRQIRRTIFIYHHLNQLNQDEEYIELLKIIQDVKKDGDISYLDVMKFKKKYDEYLNQYVDGKYDIFNVSPPN